MNDANDIAKRTLTLERTFDAPRDLVWEAWTKPEHIANWWGPPGMETRIDKHDFTEGGDWEYTMAMPDGKDFKAFGTYERIVAPEELQTTANFIPMTEGVTLVAIFTEDGNKTGFVFKVIHPTEEYCKQQEEMGFYNGWVSVFNRLNDLLLQKIKEVINDQVENKKSN